MGKALCMLVELVGEKRPLPGQVNLLWRNGTRGVKRDWWRQQARIC